MKTHCSTHIAHARHHTAPHHTQQQQLDLLWVSNVCRRIFRSILDVNRANEHIVQFYHMHKCINFLCKCASLRSHMVRFWFRFIRTMFIRIVFFLLKVNTPPSVEVFVHHRQTSNAHLVQSAKYQRTIAKMRPIRSFASACVGVCGVSRHFIWTLCGGVKGSQKKRTPDKNTVYFQLADDGVIISKMTI